MRLTQDHGKFLMGWKSGFLKLLLELPENHVLVIFKHFR